MVRQGDRQHAVFALQTCTMDAINVELYTLAWSTSQRVERAARAA